jgi:16S rRNA (uracil1498-N3)-methyltransferase
VLRLTDGTNVEVFDDHGAVGEAVLVLNSGDTFVRVNRVETVQRKVVELTIAAAVPKGDRADWMVEKLSELGVAEFIPLAAARSVVLPTGRSKHDRWLRIATEAAKQSRRAGVMRVIELMGLGEALGRCERAAWFLSTEVRGLPVRRAVEQLSVGQRLTAFVGPEGGWAPQEVEQFLAAGATPLRLTSTILRVETAAVTTAALVACMTPLDGATASDDDPAATDESADNSTTGTPP